MVWKTAKRTLIAAIAVAALAGVWQLTTGGGWGFGVDGGADNGRIERMHDDDD